MTLPGRWDLIGQEEGGGAIIVLYCLLFAFILLSFFRMQSVDLEREEAFKK